MFIVERISIGNRFFNKKKKETLEYLTEQKRLSDLRETSINNFCFQIFCLETRIKIKIKPLDLFLFFFFTNLKSQRNEFHKSR